MLKYLKNILKSNTSTGGKKRETRNNRSLNSLPYRPKCPIISEEFFEVQISISGRAVVYPHCNLYCNSYQGLMQYSYASRVGKTNTRGRYELCWGYYKVLSSKLFISGQTQVH